MKYTTGDIADQLRATIAEKDREIERLKAEKSAINTNVRLFDLVRYARTYLHDEQLIDMEEYAWLCGEAPMSKGGGSPSPRRLEDYDKIREREKQQAAELTSLRALCGRAVKLDRNWHSYTGECENCKLLAEFDAAAKG